MPAISPIAVEDALHVRVNLSRAGSEAGTNPQQKQTSRSNLCYKRLRMRLPDTIEALHRSEKTDEAVISPA